MKNFRFFSLSILLLLMGGLLSACSGSAAINSYPGLTAGQSAAYLADHNSVYAVNTKDGSLLWRFPEKVDNAKSFYATPVLVGETLYIGDYLNNLYALNASNGSQTWAFQAGDQGHFVGSPLVTNDAIFAPSSDHYLYALTLDGKLRWKYKTGNILWAQPATDGKLLYLPGMDHVLYALNPSDGSLVWEKDLGSALLGSPVIGADGTVYAIPMDGNIFALDSSNGTERWAVPPVGGQVWATPILKDNALYFGSTDGKVYSVSTDVNASSRVIWTVDLGDPVIGGGALLQDGLVFPTEDGTAYSVSFKGEKTSMKLAVNGKLYTTPVVTNDLVILAITSGDNALAAFDLNGTEKWPFALPK